MRFLLLIPFITLTFASETLFKGQRGAYPFSMQDNQGRMLPAILSYSSDGSGNTLPIIASTSTATLTTSVNVALVSVVILAANPNRRGFMLYNNSANSAYVTYGATSASGTPSFILPTFTQYIHTLPVVYTGVLSAIRNAGSGTITATEF